MAAIRAAVAASAFSEEESRKASIELEEIENLPTFTDIDQQLRDEQDSLESPAVSPTRAAAPHTATPAHLALSNDRPAASPSLMTSVQLLSPARRFSLSGVSLATAGAVRASRSARALQKFKSIAKRWLWRHRKLKAEVASRHQMWWLISGTERAIKRNEFQEKFKGDGNDAAAMTSVENFMPISGKLEVNRLPWYIIDPQGTFQVLWTFLMTILLLYCALTIPYFIAFDQAESFRWADAAVDCMFLCDIVVSFLTAYEKDSAELEFQLEINPRVLAKRYLRGWFVLDLLGTIPFTEIMRDIPGADAYPRIIKIIRILRLLKLLRLSRFGKKAEFIKNFLKLHVFVFRAAKFLVFFFLLAHIMANVLVITAEFSSDEHEKPMNWLTESRAILKEGVGMVPISEGAEATRYLMALYWAFTTIITVGYGDIYPVQTAEAGVCLLSMIIGGAVVSFIVGNVHSMLEAADPTGGIGEKLADLNHKYKLDRLAPELQRSMQLWHSTLKKATGDMAPHWPGSLDALSPAMRGQMVENVARPALLASRMFPENKQLHQALYGHIQRHVYCNRDIIYRTGDACNRIYFIVQGAVELRLPDCAESLLTLGKDYHFGVMAVVSTEQLVRYDAVASQVTVCLSLTHEAIHQAMKETNCPVSQMKTFAMHHDVLLMRCLKVSKKIFRAMSFGAGDVESDERVLKYQEKLRDLSVQLFHPDSRVKNHDRMHRRVSFQSSDVSAFNVRSGKLKSLLQQFKGNEDKRIEALETAKKEVTHIIQMYEDVMLRSDKAEELR